MKVEEAIKKLEDKITSNKRKVEVRKQFSEYFTYSKTEKIKEEIQLDKQTVIWLKDYMRLKEKMAADA